MAIRLRTINGLRIAVCAVETDRMAGDTYLDDGDHYALAAKFAHDWQGREPLPVYDEHWAVMATQKARDAKEEIEAWVDQDGGKG